MLEIGNDEHLQMLFSPFALHFDREGVKSSEHCSVDL